MAVYTEITNNQLDSFLTLYNVGKAISCKGIAEGVENTNYLLRTIDKNYILTIYEKRVRLKDLPFFLGLMNHLSINKVPCPIPILSTESKLFNVIGDKPAALISFLEGLCVDNPNENHCYQVGNAMALMHKESKSFSLERTNSLSISGWDQILNKLGKLPNTFKVGWSNVLKNEVTIINDIWPNNLPKGIIHADLFPDNVFFINDTLSGLIDFYFACNDFLAYDIAIALNAWCFNKDGKYNKIKGKALIKGYESIRKLSNEEIQNLPVLARGAAFRFLLTRLDDWLNQVDGAMVKPKDPLEFWEKLIFHKSIIDISEYGF
ncbi:homoserine kinase [Alphaproteobacteria bacterium]|nr:homoserine kinase [Alphaproteobacteria bacterium]